MTLLYEYLCINCYRIEPKKPTEKCYDIIIHHQIPVDTIPLAKAADETQNEEEPCKLNISLFWSPFLYMLINRKTAITWPY